MSTPRDHLEAAIHRARLLAEFLQESMECASSGHFTPENIAVLAETIQRELADAEALIPDA